MVKIDLLSHRQECMDPPTVPKWARVDTMLSRGNTSPYTTFDSHPAPSYAAIEHIFSDGFLAFQRS